VRSRWPCRPTLPAAVSSLSTSSGVRCSRARRAAFVRRRGGRGEPRLDRDRRSWRLCEVCAERTFPFSSVG